MELGLVFQRLSNELLIYTVTNKLPYIYIYIYIDIFCLHFAFPKLYTYMEVY